MKTERKRGVVKRAVAHVMVLAMVMSGLLFTDVLKSEAAADKLTGKTANEIVELMGKGWNLGNTFDSTGGSSSDIYSYEKSWGNPVVTKKLIDGVKAAGFDTIRIPVTWYRAMSKDGKYTIDSAYLARVKEVVDYAYDNEMFIILNVHHEDWINNPNLVTNKAAIAKELEAVWKQLADCFADYDQHLIFEGMNEPRLANTDVEWSGNAKAYETVNYLGQVFAATIRANGKGYNSERCLMIPGYAASSSAVVMNSFTVPTYEGKAVSNIIASVHCYSPNAFCLSDDMSDFSADNPAHTNEIDRVFTDINKIFLSEDIPVVIGECSATNTNNNTKARKAWAKYMGIKSSSYGIPIVFWDNGYNGTSGGECHSYIDRNTGEDISKGIIDSFKAGYKSVKWQSAVVDYSAQEAIAGGELLWQDTSGKAIEKSWSIDYVQAGSKSSYFADGMNIAVVYTGSTPKLIMDAPSAKEYWIPVDESKNTDTLGSYKVAYFSSDLLVKAAKEKGIKDYSLIANIYVISPDGKTVCYEVSAKGKTPMVSFMVFGNSYYTGTKLPKNPKVDGYKFVGWYTTKTYKEGTELDISKLKKDTTAYAMFALESDKGGTGNTGGGNGDTSVSVSKPAIKKVAVSQKGFKLTWGEVADASGYYILRSTNSGGFTKIKDISNNSTTTYKDTAANKNGAKYSYKLVAYKTVSGKTYTSKESAVVTKYFLTRTKLKSAKNTSAKKATVKWKKNSKATGYQVKYVLGKKAVKKNVASKKKSTLVLKSLKKGKTYKVYVRAYKKVGKKKYYSAWSKAKKVKIIK